MKYRRALFTLTLLPSGQVLATVGIDWTTNTYPATQAWSDTRILNDSVVAMIKLINLTPVKNIN